jgi:RNA polymerase sigma factor (TIGR02999 family)
MGDVTELLARWNQGDARALDDLMPVVYTELRRTARHYMRLERADHTLQPTELVHEVFLRLAGVRLPDFHDRAHFYGVAAQAMRRILVDHSRRRRALKRGQDGATLNFGQAPELGIDLRLDFVALDDALERLTSIAARPAKVVELRYFGGLSIDETAAFLRIAPATVKRNWAFARAWLRRELNAA